MTTTTMQLLVWMHLFTLQKNHLICRWECSLHSGLTLPGGCHSYVDTTLNIVAVSKLGIIMANMQGNTSHFHGILMWRKPTSPCGLIYAPTSKSYRYFGRNLQKYFKRKPPPPPGHSHSYCKADNLRGNRKSWYVFSIAFNFFCRHPEPTWHVLFLRTPGIDWTRVSLGRWSFTFATRAVIALSIYGCSLTCVTS